MKNSYLHIIANNTIFITQLLVLFAICTKIPRVVVID